MPWVGDQIMDDENRALKKFGVTDIHMPADKVALIKSAWSKSLWALARKCCGDGADDLYAIARRQV